MKTIVVFNQKGGVGKTSTVANLMAELKLKGYAVLGIDLDAQANLTAFNKIINPERTVRDLLLNTCSADDVTVHCKYGDVIPSDTSLQNELLRFASMPAFVIRIRDILKPLSSKYDYIFIDCPPAVNQVTAAALVAADYVIVPAEAEYFSAVGIKMIVNTVEQVKPLNPGIKVLGVLLVKYQNRRNLTKSLESVLNENVNKLLDCGIFSTKIRFTVDIPSSQASGLSVRDFKSGSKATKDYEDLSDEILKEMKK